jgi:hypothetical protein
LSASREESFKNQALAYARVFFLVLDRSYGIKFSDEEKFKIINEAFRDAANHINRHVIFQKTLDGLKLTSFLAYFAASHVLETTSHGGHIDPAKTACQAGVERLSALLKLGTSSNIVLSESEKGYLMSMFYDELNGCKSSGIGANGLSTVFSFLMKVKPDPDRLANI